MKCNINYIGESESGLKEYYCYTHKYMASDENGNKLEECLCPEKELFNNVLDLKNTQVSSLKIVYENLLDNKKPKIYINNEEFNGVLTYDTSTITYKEFGGIMLSRLNYLSMKHIKCKHCNHYHSDNGKYAYTPHRTHLCYYCGLLFRDDEKSIGNELDIFFKIPYINLEENTITITDKIEVEYDLFSGIILINKQNVDNLIIDNKEISLKEYLNDILKEEY